MASALTQEIETWFMSLLGFVPEAAKTAAAAAPGAASPSIGVGITSDVGAGFQAVTAVAGVVKQEDAEVNTPAEIKAAEQAQKQKLADQMCRALAENDTATIQKLIAGK